MLAAELVDAALQAASEAEIVFVQGKDLVVEYGAIEPVRELDLDKDYFRLTGGLERRSCLALSGIVVPSSSMLVLAGIFTIAMVPASARSTPASECSTCKLGSRCGFVSQPSAAVVNW